MNQERKVAFAATIGTIIEQYDFFIYNTAAALVFSKLFFPQVSPAIGTMLAFSTSATGFAARPIGAIVSGHFGDRVGRKALLLATILIMGIATFAIGLLPTYDSIGIAAPIALLTLRVIQGFAVGGEFGGASLMISESVPANRRGVWGSLITVGILAGLIIGTILFSSVTSLLSEDSFMSWGWRVPFLLSAVLVAVGIYVRVSIAETPEFLRMIATGRKAENPLMEALKQPKSVITIFFMRVAENFSFYVFSAFSLSYIAGTLGLPRSLALNAVMIASLVECVTAIGFGALADRIGARRIMVGGLIFQMLFAFPFFWLLDTGNHGWVFVGIIIAFALCNGPISAVQPGWLPRFFSVNSRASGLALGRELASVAGGGVAPLVATALVSSAHSSWPVAAAMAGTTFLGLIAMISVRQMDQEWSRQENERKSLGGTAVAS
ncbi:MAG: MHS family MFS transporter [Rhizobiaceae bacterium]|nr:MHS family MFS transporter [Rhizobiaceae bacterium]